MLTWNTKVDFGVPFSQEIFTQFSFALALTHFSIFEECVKALVSSLLTDS
jgi:hypothetical protein